MPSRTLTLRLVLLVCLCSGATRAESSFLLAYPESFGNIPAATYDEAGLRIGGATLLVERLDSGHVRLRSESGQRAGAQTIATAELVPVEEEEHALRVLRQQSRSLDEHGAPLGTLTLDHEQRIARCADSTGSTVSELALPDADRVVNVPMNLFFQPLVRGDADKLEFQVFLCRPNARLMDFVAWAVRRDAESPIEIRYGPDLGIASSLVRQLVPKLSFWFDPHSPHLWLAHRLPLYSGGPEVMVVRDSVPPSGLVR
jgi:hypothetical protein